MFWGNLPYSINIFGIQKRKRSELLWIEELETLVGNCLKHLKICSFLFTAYIFPIIIYSKKEKDQAKPNEEIHSFNTR